MGPPKVHFATLMSISDNMTSIIIDITSNIHVHT